jgi:SOS-response transcriptional repressor LexA
MPVISLETRKAEYVVLKLALPGRAEANAAVLLLDTETDRLACRFREDLESLADPEDAGVVAALPEDFARKAEEIGGRRFLEQLEDTLSNALRLTERQRVAVRDTHAALERLFLEEVLGITREPREVVPFRTHLPVYSLRAAAGRFGEDMEVEEEGWTAAPAGLRLTSDMYVAHVRGHSMEPEIPDGSRVVFRYAPAGSRQGKRVLVWQRAASGGGGEFTLKVYESRKQLTPEGWRHERILLKPLNPEYEILELAAEDDKYRILGEYVCTLAIDD